MIKTILLSKNGSTKNISINKIKFKDILTINTDIFKYKGVNELSIIHKFNYKNALFYLIGWEDGSHSNINKHELPPPIDNTLFYGDLLVIKVINNKIKNLLKKEYLLFYEYLFGGFEDLGSEDTEDSYEPEIEIDEDYNPDDDNMYENNSIKSLDETEEESEEETEEESEYRSSNETDEESESLELYDTSEDEENNDKNYSDNDSENDTKDNSESELELEEESS